MDGGFSDTVGDYVIIDCRFGYEYEGGHITGALHCAKAEELGARFFTPEALQSTKAGHSSKPPVYIFHCEFSQSRGPNM